VEEKDGIMNREHKTGNLPGISNRCTKRKVLRICLLMNSYPNTGPLGGNIENKKNNNWPGGTVKPWSGSGGQPAT